MGIGTKIKQQRPDNLPTRHNTGFNSGTSIIYKKPPLTFPYSVSNITKRKIIIFLSSPVIITVPHVIGEQNHVLGNDSKTQCYVR